MHELVWPFHFFRRPGLLVVFLVLSLWLAATQQLQAATDETAPVFSIESPLAVKSLLLGITRAGNRLVTVGDRGHILYSDNEGQSWQQAVVPTRQQLTASYFVDELHGWTVGHDALILYSNDGGANWVEQYRDESLEAPLLDVWFANAKQGFAVGAYGTLLQTQDGGQNWEDVSDLLDNEDGLHLNALTAIRGGGLFIVGEMGAMFRSADQGASWEMVDSPYEGSLFGVLPTTAEQGMVVYGLRGHLYRSADFGDSWEPVELRTEQGNPLSFGLADGTSPGEGRLLVVGHGGSLLDSKDDGRSFSVQLREDRQSYAGVALLNDGKLLLVGQGGIRHH